MARKLEYPTGSPDGMSHIPATGWRFTGPEGYRVQFTGTGDTAGNWSVFRYTAAESRLVPGGRDLSNDEAHEMAARLAGTVPHPEED